MHLHPGAEAPEDSLAEQFDTSPQDPESAATGDKRERTQRSGLARFTPKSPRTRSTRIARTADAAAPSRRAARKPRNGAHPMRSLLTVTAVAGLVAAVGIPSAFATAGSANADAGAVTLQRVSIENAQNLVIASEATPAALERGGYSATTPEEIQAKKDKEAAEAAALARAASGSAAYSGAIPLTIAPAGSVVRPLPHFNTFGSDYAGHKGVDYMADRGTPIYSIADGVVIASTESGPGWGVYVQIAHNIGGQTVTSLYAHMDYGTRRVTVGESVQAGQLIGQVGDTGRAYGTHLHLEIYVNGSWVNGESWLIANAG